MNFIVPLVLCFRVWACSLLFIEKIKKKKTREMHLLRDCGYHLLLSVTLFV